MWYEDLLNLLTHKVIEVEQNNAKKFLNVLLKDAAQSPLEAQMILGLIERMYKKYDQVKNNSVKLADFTRDLLGLTLIYAKYSSDAAVWNEDLKGIWSNTEMMKFLGYTSNNFNELRPEIVALEMSKLIELNYSFKIDFNYLLMILSRKEFTYLIRSIYCYFDPLLILDENELFTMFLYEVIKLVATENEKKVIHLTPLKKELLAKKIDLDLIVYTINNDQLATENDEVLIAKIADLNNRLFIIRKDLTEINLKTSYHKSMMRGQEDNLASITTNLSTLTEELNATVNWLNHLLIIIENERITVPNKVSDLPKTLMFFEPSTDSDKNIDAPKDSISSIIPQTI